MTSPFQLQLCPDLSFPENYPLSTYSPYSSRHYLQFHLDISICRASLSEFFIADNISSLATDPSAPTMAPAAVIQGSNTVSEICGSSLNEPQPVQSTSPRSESLEKIQVGRQTVERGGAKSLFGPFPTSAGTSNDNQQGATSEGPAKRSAEALATATDPIEYSNENNETDTNALAPTLNFDPKIRGPLTIGYANKSPISDATQPPPLTREQTLPAIGPATDKPTLLTKESDIEGPVLFITLLLSSTGARHPYKLDEKYLRKRNVTVEGNNPINISLYKLKELILRDWREGRDLTQDDSADSTKLLANILASRVGGQAIQPRVHTPHIHGQDAQ